MSERYTEKARRAVFFARYEAGTYGSAQIDTEHLLLGLLREPNPAWSDVLGEAANIDAIRLKMGDEAEPANRVPTNRELPLSAESKHALKFATEDYLGRKDIGVRCLLAGLLRADNGRVFQILQSRGVDIEKALARLRTWTDRD